MLIIFDLDDTLIDTSGSVTPFKMKECLRKLIREGVSLPDFEQAYADLLAINSRSLRSKDALTEFLDHTQASPHLIDSLLEEMTTPLPPEFVVATTPNAKEILQELRQSHTLTLVTGGHPLFQLEKLEKAGIDLSFFSNIAIPEDSVKKPFYRRLIEEFLPPSSREAPQLLSKVLVCGDRIAMDLVPAFELGCTTVHMRWGRGRVAETEPWVHHAISDLRELKRIVRT